MARGLTTLLCFHLTAPPIKFFIMSKETQKSQKRLENALELAGVMLAKFENLYEWEINFFLEALDEMYFSYIQSEFSDNVQERSTNTFAYQELKGVLTELNSFNKKHLTKLQEILSQTPCTETA